jgi:hypothetical protein
MRTCHRPAAGACALHLRGAPAADIQSCTDNGTGRKSFGSYPNTVFTIELGRVQVSEGLNGSGDAGSEPLQLVVPESAQLPEGATFFDGPDDARCRLIRPDGERCRGKRIRAYGLCPGHAGTGAVAADPRGMAARAAQARTERRERRLLLGVTRMGAADPRLLVRERLQERREQAARAVVDGVLDDPKLSGLDKQTGMLRAIDAAYPQVTAQLTVDLPGSPEEAGDLSWDALRQLAAAHLPDSSDTAGVLEPRMDTGVEG